MSEAVKLRVGPRDHGRRIGFDEFAEADFQEGYHYELARGVIEVTDVPAVWHDLMLMAINLQFDGYILQTPGEIYLYATQPRLRLPAMESDRHPDRAIYLAPPPDGESWTGWIPDIAIEVVSPGRENRQRDYVTKREEYLVAGVREYWIIDRDEEELIVLLRMGDTWSEKRFSAEVKYETPLLPGFTLDLGAVFEAGGRSA